MSEASDPRRSVVEGLKGWSSARWRRHWTLLAALAAALTACSESSPLDPAREQESNTPDSVVIGYRLVPGWPHLPDVRLGEVTGVDVDSHGHVFVFQRGPRSWDINTIAPISETTVWQLDAATGAVLNAWGANQFRLPHGLTVDRNDNIWLTDAALHQVFQFTHDGALLKTLGEANVGRWDRKHFNRPTDVTVRADGGFYVSDGYENQRVIELDAQGEFLREWGRLGSADGEFALPHAIASARGTLYVADRENNRIAVFDTSGVFQRTRAPVPQAMVYAVSVDTDGNLFAGLRNDGLRMGGVVRLDANGRITHALGAMPDGTGEFLAVHDIALGRDGSIYVAENRTAGLRKYVPVRGRAK